MGKNYTNKIWYVYIVLCSTDNTLYIGITTDLDRRIKQHNDNKGAKYTKGRGPIILQKSFEMENKSEALKLEYHIKQLPKEEKINFDVKTWQQKNF